MQPEKPLPPDNRRPARAALSTWPDEIHQRIWAARGNNMWGLGVNRKKKRVHQCVKILFYSHFKRWQTGFNVSWLSVRNNPANTFSSHSWKCNALWMSIMMQLSVLIQIDYQTFLTLSDDDLKEVGVSTFGARRKMLLAISGESLKSWRRPGPTSLTNTACGTYSCCEICFFPPFRPEQKQEAALRHTCGEACLPGRRC